MSHDQQRGRCWCLIPSNEPVVFYHLLSFDFKTNTTKTRTRVGRSPQRCSSLSFSSTQSVHPDYSSVPFLPDLQHQNNHDQRTFVPFTPVKQVVVEFPTSDCHVTSNRGDDDSRVHVGQRQGNDIILQGNGAQGEVGLLVDSEIVLSTRYGKVMVFINKTLSTETSYQRDLINRDILSTRLIVGKVGSGMWCVKFNSTSNVLVCETQRKVNMNGCVRE